MVNKKILDENKRHIVDFNQTERKKTIREELLHAAIEAIGATALA